jgi:hypothetical protein
VIPALGSILAPASRSAGRSRATRDRWNAAGGAAGCDPQSPGAGARDSFTEAPMLDDDETFPVALAAGLRDAVCRCGSERRRPPVAA